MPRGRPKGNVTDCPHTDRPVYAKGKCKNCWIKGRYWINIEYRKKKMAYNRIKTRNWMRKKCKENPKYNAKRQRDFRKKHPDSFNYLMARYYLRKLTPENREKMLKEISIGREGV